MRCEKCGAIINELNHYYIPDKMKDGKRLCIKCAKEDRVVSLV